MILPYVVMINSQNNKKIKNHGESFGDFTKEYSKNERPTDESHLDRPVDKVKAGTKLVIDRVENTDKVLGTHYCKVTASIFYK